MKAMTLAAATGLAGALFVLTPAQANTVWDFNAGLPGLVAACGGLLALARRRRKLVA
jgi:hypothetical protein